MTQQETPKALVALLTWETSGAMWATEASAQSAVVDLITCDGAAVVGRVVSSDPEFVAYVQTDADGRTRPRHAVGPFGKTAHAAVMGCAGAVVLAS